MPLDSSFAGRTLSSETPYEVGREKIREFADAIGDPNPAYRDPEAAKAFGHRDVIAPPTFPVVFTFAAGRPLLAEMGIELSRIVHGDQCFRYARPIHPGDVLGCGVSIESVRSLAGNDIVVMRTDVTAEDGEHVLTTWSTLVIR
ncbi:MAG TPA: MaoC family dehydratase N-terminal domain-containing protein [Micromonosporaceae bacterium]